MALASDPDVLVPAARDGDRRALARVITLVEKGGPEGRRALALAFPHTGRAHVVGITGAPGAGKSTLTDRLIRRARGEGTEVAVLAVDPSSPYTGGAILGDRIRMQEHIADRGVYIRSMASRGHLGGLSAATPRAVAVLDAAGFPLLLVETVGVGQAEVEIADRTDTTVVVVNPGWGDTIQAAKAGLLEVGDVFVVNKADRPGVEATVRDLEQMLDMGGHRPWRPPVLTTEATADAGIDELWAALVAHHRHLVDSGELERRRAVRLEDELRAAITVTVEQRTMRSAAGDAYRQAVADVVARRVDPWTAAARLLGE